jgi:hypothetical protein
MTVDWVIVTGVRTVDWVIVGGALASWIGWELWDYLFPMGGGGGRGDEKSIRADDLFDPTSDLYRRHWRYSDRGPRRD